ncbi:phosphonate metabolism protein/1,5-bisphosphokinase (PRPP-forming) PhnN [Dichotomicrobium thermohalophilum]|uniref:Ribose 1,5-bisphosphate phosphokinase PhnN n=1 Tax=Dichotomicrobium thermohalophilum TaxID=933063 RepID=A0A397PDP1_9HYPH|nr:phosphonate metabolism protein/1,5-bisphosphokinase (PRPP-forming) PhnN [Dichotomicrobium thermohalophilum]RIA47620.1 ribose 1,5-bisphosphokinase [Dichotomicrobium thermohalophilum]
MAGAKEAGPGVLVLVAGPSGAGKDTLIGAARAHFHGDERFAFPRRIVTRASDGTEQVREVSLAEFDAMEHRGGLFLAWRAHGLAYGVPVDARDHLGEGRVVVVNVSRRIIRAAFSVWPRSHAVYVHVAQEILQARLQRRGRETAEQIGARLSRAATMAGSASHAPEGTTVIDNSGPLEHATRAFIDTLEAQADRAQRAMSRKGAA